MGSRPGPARRRVPTCRRRAPAAGPPGRRRRWRGGRAPPPWGRAKTVTPPSRRGAAAPRPRAARAAGAAGEGLAPRLDGVGEILSLLLPGGVLAAVLDGLLLKRRAGQGRHPAGFLRPGAAAQARHLDGAQLAEDLEGEEVLPLRTADVEGRPPPLGRPRHDETAVA